jgi:DNA (cytosine-5)-methyltransferase 3A
MKVLSLFDGISCGMVALERAKIPVEEYHAYEIEPYAIKISKKNYPEIIHHGDVFDTDFCTFAIQKIDLLMGGSPCTFWSNAKCHTAKQKKEVDPDGVGWKLFLKFVEALHNVKPRYFLYENNYGISENIKNEISKKLEVDPIMIDSALVSAQRRKRYYWTNIPNVAQPDDKGIKVRDIIVNNPSLTKTFDERIKNSMIWTDNYIKYDLGGKGHYSQQDRLYFLDGKAPTIARCRTETKFNVWLGGEKYKKTCPIKCERLQTLPDDYTAGIPKTRRFEAIGNGWTVDVIAHIFGGLK